MAVYRKTFRRKVCDAIHQTHHAHGFSSDLITAAVMKVVNTEMRRKIKRVRTQCESQYRNRRLGPP